VSNYIRQDGDLEKVIRTQMDVVAVGLKEAIDNQVGPRSSLPSCCALPYWASILRRDGRFGPRLDRAGTLSGKMATRGWATLLRPHSAPLVSVDDLWGRRDARHFSTMWATVPSNGRFGSWLCKNAAT
jgi:hypothetical protein